MQKISEKKPLTEKALESSKAGRVFAAKTTLLPRLFSGETVGGKRGRVIHGTKGGGFFRQNGSSGGIFHMAVESRKEGKKKRGIGI
jgi:hypothetical protein